LAVIFAQKLSGRRKAEIQLRGIIGQLTLELGLAIGQRGAGLAWKKEDRFSVVFKYLISLFYLWRTF